MRLCIVYTERLYEPLAPEVVHFEARGMAGRKEGQGGDSYG